MLSYGPCLLYLNFFKVPDLEERRAMKMRQLIHHVSKAEVPSHETSLVLEFIANDNEDEAVEVPFILMQI
jgi:hypothetical protein